jgi:hypothetical protein
MESFFGRFQREPVHQGICRPFFDVFLALVDGSVVCIVLPLSRLSPTDKS